MPELYIARLTAQRMPFGPFDGQQPAARFAGFLAAEIDPATVERLRDPVAELLAWHDSAVTDPEQFLPDVIGYRVGDQLHAPEDVTIIRRDQPVAALNEPTMLDLITTGQLRHDGHRQGCELADAHFFPTQCKRPS